MIFEYAVRYAEAVKNIRRKYAEKFFWLDQGDKVQCPNGRIGVVETMLYNPRLNSYFIFVAYGSTGYTTSDPHELVLVEQRVSRHKGVVDASKPL